MANRDSGALAALKPRERKFVLAYTGEARSNGTKAAEIAGYSSASRGALSVRAHGLLRSSRVKAAIEEIEEANQARSVELIRALSDQATADPSELYEHCFRDVTYERRDRKGMVHLQTRKEVDWEEVRRRGLGRLIKKVVPAKGGDIVELHDPQRAAELILRSRGAFTDNLRIQAIPPEELDRLTPEQLEDLAQGKGLPPR